jgi:adenosylhomocysteine nucleosidase
MRDIALIAALEREVRPLVKSWRRVDREHAGRRFCFFESENCVAVCGGMGPEAARRAAEAATVLYAPRALYSVGFAGALNATLRVGRVIEPRYVVDAGDGSRIDAQAGSGTLVSFASVAGKEQKIKLANAYGAEAVDMEAAAVARAAEAHGLRFATVKVISDELGFPMLDVAPFTSPDGKFREATLVIHAALRPRLWPSLIRLARNSVEASRALSEYLAAALLTKGAESHAVLAKDGH